MYEKRTQQLQPSIQSSSVLFSQPCPYWAGLLWNLTEGALFLPLPIYRVNILKIQPSLSKLSLEDILYRRSPKTWRCPALTHVCTVVYPAAPHILQEECSLHTRLALPGKQNWFFSNTKDCHRLSLFVMFTDTQSNSLWLWEMRINTNSWPHSNDKNCSCCGCLAVIGWDCLLEQYLIFWFKWVAFTHSKMKTYSLLLRLPKNLLEAPEERCINTHLITQEPISNVPLNILYSVYTKLQVFSDFNISVHVLTCSILACAHVSRIVVQH